jgi:hypothetical protein
MLRSAIAAGKKAMGLRSKRAQNEGDELRAAVNKDFQRMNNRGMTPAKWKCDAFLESQGLHNEFAWLENNVGMGVFSNFHYLTYRSITVELISTFSHTLDDLRVEPSCSFML